jgi:hypothetical protein
MLPHDKGLTLTGKDNILSFISHNTMVNMLRTADQIMEGRRKYAELARNIIRRLDMTRCTIFAADDDPLELIMLMKALRELSQNGQAACNHLIVQRDVLGTARTQPQDMNIYDIREDIDMVDMVIAQHALAQVLWILGQMYLGKDAEPQTLQNMFGPDSAVYEAVLQCLPDLVEIAIPGGGNMFPVDTEGMGMVEFLRMRFYRALAAAIVDSHQLPGELDLPAVYAAIRQMRPIQGIIDAVFYSYLGQIDIVEFLEHLSALHPIVPVIWTRHPSSFRPRMDELIESGIYLPPNVVQAKGAVHTPSQFVTVWEGSNHPPIFPDEA